MQNDFAALTCAQNRPPEKFEAISETCEQVLWGFKFNLTKSKLFLDQIHKACARDTDALGPCEHNNPIDLDAGHYMSCVIDLKFEGTLKPACESFLTQVWRQIKIVVIGFFQSIFFQVESVIFSDYRLIGDFANKCQEDIESNVCGHVRRQVHSDSQTIFYHHSQGLVLECLSEHVDQVKPECKTEILKVAELQSDDYHLDRTLFFACKGDREKLCSDVKAGDGRIYECLLKHKEVDLTFLKCFQFLNKHIFRTS